MCDTGRILHTVRLPGVAEMDKTRQISTTQEHRGERTSNSRVCCEDAEPSSGVLVFGLLLPIAPGLSGVKQGRDAG